jgi:glucosamine--fructose-6-phosphate aminotransferase (isomerizing)
MKHGPIALIDELMPVVALLPHDAVYEKMLGNIQEAKARGGTVIAVANPDAPGLDRVLDADRDAVIHVPACPGLTSPIVSTLPLQLLAYHVAVRRGCDVDQPRNLAKSVTVE